MNYLQFRTTFKGHPVFSLIEIKKYFPKFDAKNLVNWQAKNYVQKIRNSWYRFTENPLNTDVLFFISNHIYAPSYISLESAFSYYGFIPEGVFQITAISTLKTQIFEFSMGYFKYQNLKPNMFFGYVLMPFNDFRYKIADPQKCLLDFLYLHPDIKTEGHFYEMRFNISEIKRQVDFKILEEYCQMIDSKALSKRVKTFIRFIENN